MGDIIDLKERRNKLNSAVEKSKDSAQASVLDIVRLREQKISDDRRQTKRTILNGFIGAHVVVPNRGLLKVSIFDISRNGISFDVAPEWGHFQEQEELAMRFYFNHQTYFPFIVKITTGRMNLNEGTFRQGASFLTNEDNENALHDFINFLESVSKVLKSDKGDIFISGARF